MTYVKNPGPDVAGRTILVKDWNNHHAWPTAAGLKYYLDHADEHGFSDVVHRFAGKTYIKEQAFFAWKDGLKKS